ncbi:GNAT family N-acetyltransferase [Clostridium sp. FAM 1755]|uniref:GNAT family N-acetyltransferase n=1 Tax=Clostridium TaxID=1485 RepID=UPI0006ABD5CB|nr:MULTISPECIES: GNAT family N-acetyltransferase [Clostridium]KOR24656.1 GNAT family acetyltransferase [Clostridium sp. L74]NFV11971.1 GNAT family N-acetyltransferase [Clostridium sporogenes]
MFKCINLNKDNIIKFKELNKNSKSFNLLNEDFFDSYNNCSFIQRLFLKKRVRLLYNKREECIGYIWANTSKNICHINALNIIKTDNLKEIYNYLVKCIGQNLILEYDCEYNGYNYNILESIGFKKGSGVLELCLSLEKFHNSMYVPEYIQFETPIINQHEKIRCYIQNEVFKSNTRVPLTKEDIYFDESQDYYIKDASFFIKKNNEYIGYGQVILENNIPFIVNFGILPKFRKEGYGKILLNHILNKLKTKGFKKVMIRVSSENEIALNLYKSLGFLLYKEKHIFIMNT